MGCETKFFADRFLRDRSICDPINSFGATFALSPRVRGESRREGTLFRHLKILSHTPKDECAHFSIDSARAGAHLANMSLLMF
jgi:hypothetical protein